MTLAILILVYLIPVFIAWGRHHRNAMPITLFSLLLGWTIVGWCVALIWASTDHTKPTLEFEQALPKTKGRKTDILKSALRDTNNPFKMFRRDDETGL